MKGSALHCGVWLLRHCPRAWDQACVLFLLVTLTQGVGNAIKTEKNRMLDRKKKPVTAKSSNRQEFSDAE